MRRISSRQNPIVARFRDAARGRAANGIVLSLLDGEHLVEEALDAGVALDTVAFTESTIDARADGLVDRVLKSGAHAVRVPPPVMAAMSPVREPSGIVALAKASPASLDQVVARAPQLIALVAGVQDAGNVGAIVRAADGCGATGIIATEGTADPFGWKALRGSMGSAFRVPIAVREPLAQTIDLLKKRKIAIAAAVPRGGRPLPECALDGALAILLGSEGPGLSDEIVSSADLRITIPMRPPVESFNVAITAALILYEAAQQRSERRNVTV
ncbi:MAG TPA: RNA methyltransferase [Vicinamibacterales bacterium]